MARDFPIEGGSSQPVYVVNPTTPTEAGTAVGQVLFWDGSQWIHTEVNELYWDPVNKILHIEGNNVTLELVDDSGNVSRIRTGNSQLTLEADPDDVVPSTDMVFKMDGEEVGRFQQGKGLQSVKGFATQLWDISGGHWETAVVNTEYYSPVQHGGIYGTVYRQYFNTTLSSTSPRLDTGSRVLKMVDFVLHTKYTSANRGVAHGNMTAYGSSDNHAYIMLSGASGGGNLSFALTGYTVLTGWVDYTK